MRQKEIGNQAQFPLVYLLVHADQEERECKNDATRCSVSSGFCVSISFIRNSCAPGKPFAYTLKNLRRIGKCFVFSQVSCQSRICSSKRCSFSSGVLSLNVTFSEKRNGLSKMPLPIMAPSAPTSDTLCFAPPSDFTYPLPMISDIL